MSHRGERDSRRPSSRYSIFVGLAFLIVIVIATANTLRTRDDGILGTSEADRGEPLPEFAVPELLGSQEGDANVFQDDCETGANPCPADETHNPACEVDLPEVIRVCDLFDRPLAISFWFTGGGDCLPTQDVFDRVAARFRGRVNFLSLNVRDDRDDAAADRPRARLAGAGGLGRRRRRLQPLPGRRLPDGRLRLPGRPLQRGEAGRPTSSPSEQLTEEVERLLRESGRRAAEDR